MGGFFGVASRSSCTLDLFYGIDYHSHLGTRRGGMAVHGPNGFNRAIHNIENSPFRTKFERDVEELEGNLGIGCISDNEPQPLLVQSHLGSFAITTVGKINNTEELVKSTYEHGHTHFLEMSGGQINATELVAALINQRNSIVEGLQYVQEAIDGSMTILLMTGEGIYAARDRRGRTPVVIGKKDDAFCVSFESFAYINLGYTDFKELGPAEIAYITPEGVETLSAPGKEMKICSFLWTYYGYPTSSYEGVNVETMRYRCGSMLAKHDKDKEHVHPDLVAGVPDSGIAHAVGYANESGIPFARPFIKYTPTWPRSFMPQNQSQRNLIARMKLIPVKELIEGKKLLLIDDSIVRGTQLRETTEFLYQSGAKEVHVRPACPPLLFGCKYLNFSRSKSDLDLITRRVILAREGDKAEEMLDDYADPCSKNYEEMLEAIRKELNFTTLNYHRLDDLIESIGLEPCKLCTYCFNGKE
ncbi:MAG: amidophosphoribosyltransferase [Lachnospiraceae bacterium]|nr:amidophosphoribosyltransferase [Lachnospiraceae bacterium]MDY4968934.1 amidophosphoribosyltransferase [Lachnospiraceae bacterium]